MTTQKEKIKRSALWKALFEMLEVGFYAGTIAFLIGIKDYSGAVFGLLFFARLEWRAFRLDQKRANLELDIIEKYTRMWFSQQPFISEETREKIKETLC